MEIKKYSYWENIKIFSKKPLDHINKTWKILHNIAKKLNKWVL